LEYDDASRPFRDADFRTDRHGADDRNAADQRHRAGFRDRAGPVHDYTASSIAFTESLRGHAEWRSSASAGWNFESEEWKRRR
jgi:hypothetical protein